VLSSAYARDLGPELASLPTRASVTARASVTQAVQVAARLPAGGPALRAAAGAAFLHGMSIVMLICAAVAVAAIPASLRYLPGRAAPGDAPSPGSGSRTEPATGRTGSHPVTPDA
jgi:hypothetical protein